MTRLLLIVLVILAVAGPTLAQPVVQEHFPPNGSVQAGPCGPFGVRLQPGSLTHHENALVVRGSDTGLRVQGRTTVSTAGDSLFFEPAVPLAPGEEVTITLRGSLQSGGVALGEGLTWRVRIRPQDNAMTGALADMSARTIGLEAWFAPGSFSYLAGDWGDLDGDADQEGVLLLDDGTRHQLVTVTRRWIQQTGQQTWLVRAPAACTTDNPVDLALIDLDGGHRQDIVLLTFSGLQVWRDPGSSTSPVGGLAEWIALPGGFNARSLTVGDLNADGHEDLVVVGLFGQVYLVLLNDGAGGLQPQTVQSITTASGDKSLPWPSRVLLADADSDGRLDLIWNADYQEAGRYPVRLARGGGDGTFGPAGVLIETDSFASGLVFGRTLDPWDDATTAPSLLTAVPEAGFDNICGLAFSGSWPGDTVGCLDGPGLAAGAPAPVLSHFLADGQGGVYPELWYVDPIAGTLTARTLGAHLNVQTRSLGSGAQAVFAGDFDYDGDGDVALLLPDEAVLILLETAGGIEQAFPGPAGVACGGTVRFGPREILCAAAQVPAHIPYTNDGLLPARIENVVLDDDTGAFSLVNWPNDWFGQGCFGHLSTVFLPVNFAPTDTIDYSAHLTVTVTWIGAAAGEDTTLVCDFDLVGRGSVFGARDGGAGPGDLTWNDGGYTSNGGALDVGLLPALSGVQVDTTVTLTNTGDFLLEAAPPAVVPDPWRIIPAGPVQIAPGDTQVWTLEVSPRADLVPAGVDTFDIGTTLNWTLQAVEATSCLPAMTLAHELRGRLLAVEPCLVADPACDDTGTACAEVDTITVLEGMPLSYCLRTRDWLWPGADPRLEIVSDLPDWLIVGGSSTDEVAPDLDYIEIWTDIAGIESTEVVLEVRDGRYQTVVRPFSLYIDVQPAQPDLMILEMLFEPVDPNDDIQQQHPFYVDVVVEAQRMGVDSADLTLDGEECVCGVGPLGKVLVRLYEGQRDTVRFLVESCDEFGDCGFMACIEPPGGLSQDWDPANNCFSLETLVGANKAPELEFFNLSITPGDPDLESCDADRPWNVITDGLIDDLGVQEDHSLRFSVRTIDPDGDPHRLELVSAPSFVSYVAASDSLLHFDIAPPPGVVIDDFCQEFSALNLRVAEFGVAVPETTTLEVPIWVKWEGPDLSVRLTNVPGSAQMQEIIRFNGSIRCLGYDSGPVSVDLRLVDPDGIEVAGRSADYDFLAAGGTATLPQVLYTVDKAGEWCAYIELSAGRDVNPGNNSASACFRVGSGPLIVSPNVATPNGDGHNDEIWFNFDNQIYEAPRVRVFELSGHKVWETDRLDSQRRLTWDGRDFDGRLVPPGTYLYVIYDESKEVAKGTCGVIR